MTDILTGHLPIGMLYTADDGEAYSVESLLEGIGDAALITVRHTSGTVCRVDRRVDEAGHGPCLAWYVNPHTMLVTCAGQLAHPAGGPAECGERLFPLVSVTGKPADQPPPGVAVPAWPPPAPRWPRFTGHTSRPSEAAA